MSVPRKRPFLRGAAVALALAAPLAVVATTAPATAKEAPARPVPAAQRPNVLFVLVDDMGYGDLSIMGNRKVATPNLDKLARDGVLLTQFHDASPICSSSRAGFMTGRFPATVGFVGITATRAKNAEQGQADWLDPKLPTLAKLLKGAGYTTAHIGKWHLGGGRDIGNAPWPTAYGFDKSFTTFEGLGPRVLVSDEERDLAQASDKLGQGPRFWENKTNLTRLYADMAVDFVAQHGDKPWFVNLWLNDVHDPWAPDDESLSEVMGKGTSSDDDRFLASLVKMDRTLGRLFQRLDQMGQLDNTLVIVTSDNGPSSLQKYYKDGNTAPGSAENLRGRKFSLYEGGIRQPLILYWRGHAKAGTRDETTVAGGVDLLPTLASIIGAPAPEGSVGIDLSPALAGTPITTRPPLFWAYGKEGAKTQPNVPFQERDVSPRFAIRDGDWKLLAEFGGAKPQLYNLASDPAEAKDLAAGQPAVRDRLLARLKSWMSSLPRYVPRDEPAKPVPAASPAPDQ
ncbi:sulfatase family protein [Sphingomonas immobilis]|uniref:Sulfatase-like hydrolase/transferase n=1 Tax=Sphingomonas immobilis TaxID=3063997 RepID=A0ABT8ZYK9_9SPHN|nr:sulfatase-like hydrolase/transferase [Sphingomonas sp. CA1-15]MDO7842665.1 sulfatase-like hydrolase/transferase [Sphingomonas sp. CA1-15]